MKKLTVFSGLALAALFIGNKANAQLINNWQITGNANVTATSFLGSTNAQPLRLVAGNTERIRILNTNGNVGIGNTAPVFKLDINGSINIATDSAYRIGNIPILRTTLNTSGYNTYLGYFSGNNSASAYLTTSIGLGAGQSNSGGGSTFVGNLAGASSTTGLENTIIGNSAGGSQTIAGNNVLIGSYTNYQNINGGGNVCVGVQAGVNNLGGYNTFLGFGTGIDNLTPLNIQNSTAIGAQAKVLASNCMILGGTTGSGFEVNVGIGLNSPTHQLQLSTDDAAKPGSSTWIIASDKRLKKDISNYIDGLAILKQINPVWFSYNGEAGMPTNKKYVGIVAQDIQKIAPYMIGSFKNKAADGTETEYLSYDANALPYILVNAVKEQEQVIENQKKELADVKSTLALLTARLSALEGNKNVTGIGNISNSDASGILTQNYPNPFERYTTIGYELKENSNVSLTVYSLTGEFIKELSTGQQSMGSYNVTWDANEVPSGTYLYVLKVNGQEIVKKAIVKK